MKIGTIELAGQTHPLCFSLEACGEVEEAFGSLEAMEQALVNPLSFKTFAQSMDAALLPMLKAGRIYAQMMGEELPPAITLLPSQLIAPGDRQIIRAIRDTISGDTKTEIQVVRGNAEATQGGEALRGCTTTATGQD